MDILNYISLLLAFFLAVLAEQDSAAAQQYVRQGCPTALRADLWALILNISNQPEVRSKVRVKSAQVGCYYVRTGPEQVDQRAGAPLLLRKGEIAGAIQPLGIRREGSRVSLLQLFST